ncbi:small subunit ribosomal protein S27e [Nematocida homosporus]|uniref:small subunit ribosomal protein S27e n=1 Tax=Nematocida homosporus TaxID=1912981 RepID=UPI0022212AA6|nr:small subunit ribosomal protein S27e [Nematocida homosporus]KAI5186604.1 small subunit ribosomal protein S27e [Nematocida homosporus]
MESLKYPSPETIKRTCKKKRLIPTPNSCFLDVKCGVCEKKTIIFSHSQLAISCKNCNTVLAKPTGGKARLTAGCRFKVKAAY